MSMKILTMDNEIPVSLFYPAEIIQFHASRSHPSQIHAHSFLVSPKIYPKFILVECTIRAGDTRNIAQLEKLAFPLG